MKLEEIKSLLLSFVVCLKKSLLKKKTNLRKNFSTFVSKLQQVNFESNCPFERSKKQIARIKTVQSEIK